MSVTVPRSEIYAFGSDSFQKMLQARLTSLSRSSDRVGHLLCVVVEVEDQFQKFHDVNDPEEYSTSFSSMTSKCCCFPL